MEGFFARLAGVFLVALVASACTPRTHISGVGDGSNTAESVRFKALVSDHLKFIGYWPGSVAAGGSIAEQTGFANFTMGAGPGASGDAAIAAGMKLVFGAPDPNGTDADFKAWVAQTTPYADNILAIFMMDEPDCQAGGDPAKALAYLSSIQMNIARVKSMFPNIPTMMTLGCAFWTYPGFYLPDGLDFIAIESYGSFAGGGSPTSLPAVGDPVTTKQQWLESLSYLKPMMTSSQRIFMLPAATEGYGTEDQLIQKANDMYEYAQTDPLIIGLFPFDWYSDTYDCASVGVFCGNGVPSGNYGIPVKGNRSLRDLPSLRATYQQIGAEITGNVVPTNPPLPPPDVPTPPTSTTTGGGASGGGTTGGVPGVYPPPGYVKLSSAASAINLGGTVSNGSYGVGLARGWAAFRNMQFVQDNTKILSSDEQWASPDVASALEAAVPRPVAYPPVGYVKLSAKAAQLNLTGTVSNGSYGVGLSRGWAAFRDGTFIPGLTGILSTDEQWATPDVASALEAAAAKLPTNAGPPPWGTLPTPIVTDYALYELLFPGGMNSLRAQGWAAWGNSDWNQQHRTGAALSNLFSGNYGYDHDWNWVRDGAASAYY
jgi:hypothetical protein